MRIDVRTSENPANITVAIERRAFEIAATELLRNAANYASEPIVHVSGTATPECLRIIVANPANWRQQPGVSHTPPTPVQDSNTSA